MPLTGRDITFTLALCLSLVAHALIVGSAAESYARRYQNPMHLPGQLVQVKDDAEDREDPRERLGDPDGQGKAVLASVGDVPMLARKSFQDQPLLSRDPLAAPANGEETSELNSPPPQAPAPPNPTPPAEQAETTPTPFGMNLPQGDLATPFGVASAATVATPPPPQQLAIAAPQPPAAHPRPTTAGTVAAPQGESDSDPVASNGSAEFRPGSTEVRIGRKFKLLRPHLSLAADQALGVLPNPTVILKLRIDRTGKVFAADVFRSSGSTAVDQPCVLAAYSWWFEPLKDPFGNPTNDVITFSIHFF